MDGDYSGELEAVDTFFVGAVKGIARVYLQTVMDCYSRHAWARLYTSKLPVTAVQRRIALLRYARRPHQDRAVG